jgi:hypothetical protein
MPLVILLITRILKAMDTQIAVIIVPFQDMSFLDTYNIHLPLLWGTEHHTIFSLCEKLVADH